MEVNLKGVLKARQVISRYLKPTPLIHYPLLSDYLGCSAFLKHEHHLPTGAFKIRGGINLMWNLSTEERKAGVITATRGNHGQSIALAAQLFDSRCVITVPEGNNPEKNEAIRSYGAELVIHGKDFDEARLKVEELRAERNMRYVHSGNEPLLIHGVGTYALEILEDLPETDYIFVPIGGGSGASGILTVVRAISPQVKVVGVQAAQAPAVYLSWKAGHPIETDSADTIADGLATRVPFEFPFSIIQKQIDEIVTVTEVELRQAVFEIFKRTHQVAEPAAAATLAAAWNLRTRLQGKNVVLILSGANISCDLMAEILGQED